MMFISNVDVMSVDSVISFSFFIIFVIIKSINVLLYCCWSESFCLKSKASSCVNDDELDSTEIISSNKEKFVISCFES